MKKQSLILMITLIWSSISCLKAQTWGWAKSGNGSYNDVALCNTNDATGNVIIAGYFSGDSVTFGSFTLYNSGASGSQDLFIAKYDASGNILWAVSAAGSTMWEQVNSITTDVNNNIYICGSFSSDTLHIGSTDLINNGAINLNDIFFAKLDPAGNFIWARSAGGIAQDYARRITISTSGELYITGVYNSASITFDAQTIPNINTGSSDVFIVKYDLAGNLIWAKGYGGNSTDEVSSITIDINNNLLICGAFMSFSFQFGTLVFPLAGVNPNLYVAKLDSSGNGIWARGTEHGLPGVGYRIATDSYGSVYLTGSFASDSIAFGNVTLYRTGALILSDIFLVKYDSTGNVIWANSASGNNGDATSSLNIDMNNNIYMCGAYASTTLTYNSLVINNTTSNGLGDIFIAKFDTAGNIGWLESAGGTEDDYCWSLSIDLPGHLYATGRFSSPTIQFGSTVLNHIGSTFTNDVFTAKLDATAGINGHENNFNTLSVFPNPFSDEVTLNKTSNTGEIIIYNVLGKVILKQFSSSGETKIQTANLSSGVYLLQYAEQNKTSNFKLVKF